MPYDTIPHDIKENGQLGFFSKKYEMTAISVLYKCALKLSK